MYVLRELDILTTYSCLKASEDSQIVTRVHQVPITLAGLEMGDTTSTIDCIQKIITKVFSQLNSLSALNFCIYITSDKISRLDTVNPFFRKPCSNHYGNVTSPTFKSIQLS